LNQLVTAILDQFFWKLIPMACPSVLPIQRCVASLSPDCRFNPDDKPCSAKPPGILTEAVIPLYFMKIDHVANQPIAELGSGQRQGDLKEVRVDEEAMAEFRVEFRISNFEFPVSAFQRQRESYVA